MPGRSNNCSSFEITARLPIQLQRERDTWSASTTGKIWQPLCFAAQRPNCQDTSHRPVAGRARAVLSHQGDGPQGRGYSASAFLDVAAAKPRCVDLWQTEFRPTQLFRVLQDNPDWVCLANQLAHS